MNWSRCQHHRLPGALKAEIRRRRLSARARCGLVFRWKARGRTCRRSFRPSPEICSSSGKLSGLRLLDLEFPDSLTKEFSGPQFGIKGTRQLTGVYGRPIIGTIVKPSVGLTPRANGRFGFDSGGSGRRFRQRRRADGQSAALAASGSCESRHASRQRSGDENGQEIDVRLQYQRSARSDAQTSRHRGCCRGHVRDGQSQQRRLYRGRLSAPPLPGADSRPPQRLGHVHAPSGAGHGFHSLPKIVAADRRRSDSRQRIEEQILRGRRIGRAIDSTPAWSRCSADIQ